MPVVPENLAEIANPRCRKKFPNEKYYPITHIWHNGVQKFLEILKSTASGRSPLSSPIFLLTTTLYCRPATAFPASHNSNVTAVTTGFRGCALKAKSWLA